MSSKINTPGYEASTSLKYIKNIKFRKENHNNFTNFFSRVLFTLNFVRVVVIKSLPRRPCENSLAREHIQQRFANVLSLSRPWSRLIYRAWVFYEPSSSEKKGYSARTRSSWLINSIFKTGSEQCRPFRRQWFSWINSLTNDSAVFGTANWREMAGTNRRFCDGRWVNLQSHLTLLTWNIHGPRKLCHSNLRRAGRDLHLRH